MSLEIIGDLVDVQRIPTGFYSLDRAFIGIEKIIGVPVGCSYEVFGVNHVGKSTFCYGLSGVLANALSSNIVLCDFEGYDIRNIKNALTSVDYTGKFFIIQNKDDEEQLDKTILKLSNEKENYSIAIIDSLGAISPIAESSGDIGEANMGRRALIVAQFNRKAIKMFRFHSQKVIFEVNHYYPRIGTRGYDTPAGEVKKYLTAVRIKLKRAKDYPDGSYVLEGEVVKNRWGYIGRKFYVFVLAGKGIHAGLTAMWDGILLGLVEYKKNIKIGDTSYGYVKDIVERAKQGDKEFFNPFFAVFDGKEIDYTEEIEIDITSTLENDEDKDAKKDDS